MTAAASASFEPDRDALQQLIQVLQHADVPTNEAQKAVIEQLDHFSATVPALPGYLVYIFAVCTNERETVRLRAGLALKNNVTNKVAVFPPEILEYVKDTIFVALQDSHSQIRNTASSIVDWLFRSLGPSNWPEAIVRLLECMNSQNQAIQESAYKAISNISRQSPRVLADLTFNNQKPFDVILPTLIHAGLTSQSVNIRSLALEAINPFIVSQPAILLQQLPNFLSNMFNLTSDPSIRVRKAVVESMNTLLSFWPDQIVPHIEPVIDFMLYCLQAKDSEEELALTAAEFLLTFTEEPDLYEQLQLHLDKFLPGLLQAIAFTPNSREVLDLDEDDYQKEDKATDIKPHIHKSRTAGATTKVPSLAARMGMTADDLAALQNGDEEEDAGDEEEEEEEEEDDDTLWTVRRAASRSLETAADVFEAALLEIFLPEVTKMLSQQDLFQREAAIHALGSVAAGCGASMHDHLPSLVPFLLESLRDPHPLIRSGAAWTLGEYSAWIASSGNSGHDFLLPTTEGLLTVALDNNKHAQSNAIRAFGYLAKEAGHTGALQPYYGAIIQAFVAAFGKYQHRNILKLYDTIAYLSDAVGLGGLDDAELLGQLMPPLIQRWQTFSDDDPNLLQLLECLTSLVVAAGSGFKPYADPVLQRAYQLVHSSLYQYQRYQEDPSNVEKPDKTWLVVSIDLISSLVQALGSDAEGPLTPFVSASDNGTLPMLLICLSYPESAVRQSTFALVGDLASKAISTLYPVLGQLLPTITDAISSQPKVANSGADSNAIWAIGELAMALGQNIEPFTSSLLDKMLPILTSIKASANLLENTAITIGRLALASPQSMAPRLDEVLRLWSQTMLHVTKGAEQDSALRGMCTAASVNPSSLQVNGQYLAEALALCQDPSPELREASEMILPMQ